jgi:hypothetical protein
MSGNRGSGSGRKGPGSSLDVCSILTFETPLFTPIPDVISRLKQGDLLTIELDTSLTSVLAVTINKEIAGTIVGAQMSTIASCLKSGFAYKGEILKLSGGNCTILITPN